MKRGSDNELVGDTPSGDLRMRYQRLLHHAKRMEREFGREEPELARTVEKLESAMYEGREDAYMALEREVTAWSMHLEG